MKTRSHSIPHSLCLLLLTLLTAFALPGLAVAQSKVGETNDGTLAYTLYDDGTAEVSKYYGRYKPSGDLVIPAEVTYEEKAYKVTSIRSSDYPGDGALYGCFGLTSVTLPETLTSIGNYAFCYCSGLTSLTFPEGLTSIGNEAFSLCSGLTSVTFPEGLTSIGNRAFSRCSSLTSVTLPQGLTSIGQSAFSYCSGLTSFSVAEGNRNFVSVDGVLFNKEVDTLIVFPVGRQGRYEVPQGVTSIGDRAFFGCSGLTSVTLPQGLTSIGDDAFYSCSGLTSVTLPQGLTSIGQSAFYYCSALTSVTLPQGLTSIGQSAFSGCSALTSVTLPQGLTSIGDAAFSRCSGLTSVTFPEGLTSIGQSAFDGCSGLTSVTLPEGLTSIGDEAFYDCSGLTSVTLPEGLTSIGDEAFAYCDGLTSVTLPQGLTSIGEAAFYGCSGLTSTYLLGKDPSGYDSFAFEGGGKNFIYVPAIAYGKYKDKFDGYNIASIPTAPLSITGSNFATCYTSKESFLIPEGLKGGIVTAAEAKDGGKLSVDWRYKAGAYVPAGVPLVLKGEEGEYERYCLPANGLSVDMSGLDQNLLRGSDEDATTTAADGVSDAVFYQFGSNTTDAPVGFYWTDDNGSAFTNPAGTCYLALPRAQYGHVKCLILDGNTVTGIDAAPTTDADAPTAQAIYTLDGRKVNATTTKGLPAGLYIVNGQKVMVK